MEILKHWEKNSIQRCNFKRALKKVNGNFDDYEETIDDSLDTKPKKYFYIHKDEAAIDIFVEKLLPKEVPEVVKIADKTEESKEIKKLKAQIANLEVEIEKSDIEIERKSEINGSLKKNYIELTNKFEKAENKLIKALDLIKVLIETD